VFLNQLLGCEDNYFGWIWKNVGCWRNQLISHRITLMKIYIIPPKNNIDPVENINVFSKYGFKVVA